MDLSASQAAIVVLEVLERQQLECEREERYEEAEQAKMRLSQLRAHEETRRREKFHSQQLADRLGAEEAHKKELQEFNQIWDRQVADFEAHAANLQSARSVKHQQDHSAWLEKTQMEVEPRAFRGSRDLVNLRKIQETLAKQKNYAVAANTKADADQMEAKDHAAWKSKREAKIASMEKHFLSKQRLEMGGLLKRIHSSREEIEQARRGELERLLLSYHHVKTQQESQQRSFQHRAEKYPKPAAVAAATTGRGRTSWSQGAQDGRPEKERAHQLAARRQVEAKVLKTGGGNAEPEKQEGEMEKKEGAGDVEAEKQGDDVPVVPELMAGA